MNPAFSVILFTTLSGAGYGLLAWVGFMIAISGPALFEQGEIGSSLWLIPLTIGSLVAGVAMTVVGLISSTFHLGKPLRAWRAFSQWRTSWLSREGVLALLTYVPALLLIELLSSAKTGGSSARLLLGGHVVQWIGGVLALLSLLTVGCTAMIYASLKPIPAWRHRLVLPVYLAFALSVGVLLLRAMEVLSWTDLFTDSPLVVVTPRFVGIPAVIVFVLAAMKLVYWRDIDRMTLPSREAATALEGFGKVSTFERPHTEANYLTREMGFVLARKHSRKLRAIALVLFAGVPLLMLFIAWQIPAMATFALWIAALSALAGAFVERWLFFAEAKHMVTLYY
jgi:DMSO reductase anchor subunit